MTPWRALALLLPALCVLPACDMLVKEKPGDASTQKGPPPSPTPTVTPTPVVTGGVADPYGFAATATGTSSISLTWSAPGLGNVATYRLAYNIGSSATPPAAPADCETASALVNIPGTSTQYTQSGLQASIGYSFRLCALNQNGERSHGVTASATTLAAPPPNASNFTATPASLTQITLNWTPATGSTTGYRVAYVQGMTAPANCATGTTFPISGASTQTYPVYGLSQSTYYSFRLCSVNGNPVPDVSAGVTATARTLGDSWTDTSLTSVPQGRDGHTAVWTGSRMIVWGGRPDGTNANQLNSGGQLDATNHWIDVTTTSAPAARMGHTAIWTGSRMIVWGGSGSGSTVLSDGGSFDPAAAALGAWSSIATTDGTTPPSARAWHTAVWTGSRMIVWGGLLASGAPTDDGGSFDPTAKSWAALGTGGDGAPPPRYAHTVVWTGTRMIVWGGIDANGLPLGDGGIYNPATGTWKRLTSVQADYAAGSDAPPAARTSHTAVWTGSALVVWGGLGATAELSDGAMYNPTTNRWTKMADSPLLRRRGHTAVWTSSRMIVWGGNMGAGFFADGAAFDPASNAWTGSTTSTGAPEARAGQTAIWNGSQMIVWGGVGHPAGSSGNVWLNSGSIYSP